MSPGSTTSGTFAPEVTAGAVVVGVAVVDAVVGVIVVAVVDDVVAAFVAGVDVPAADVRGAVDTVLEPVSAGAAFVAGDTDCPVGLVDVEDEQEETMSAAAAS